MFGVRFFMSCAVVGTYVWEGGGLNPLYGLPRRNGGGDSIDRNSFVLELEKRFSESRFFMETRPNYMGGGSGLFTFFSA